MDGRLVPDGYGDLQPFARNLIGNIAAVQFDHRLLATLTLLSASGLSAAAWPYRDRLGWRAAFVAVATVAQYLLGVATLLLVVPVDLAVTHQVCATILLTAVLVMAHAIRFAPRRAETLPATGHGQTAEDTPFYDPASPSAAARSAAEDPEP
jgi:cytochrome c oxidase assembly protein subunit 15